MTRPIRQARPFGEHRARLVIGIIAGVVVLLTWAVAAWLWLAILTASAS